jgi:predicted nucleic acid-binding protein
VLNFFETVDPNDLFISVLTIGELRRGLAMRRRSDPSMVDQLSKWVDDTENKFADRILPVDVPAARLWGELSSIRSLPVVDTLIAATAISRGLTLATRNVRDVEPTGVAIYNPWLA